MPCPQVTKDRCIRVNMKENVIYMILIHFQGIGVLGDWLRLNVIHEPNLTLIYDYPAQNNLELLDYASNIIFTMTK